MKRMSLLAILLCGFCLAGAPRAIAASARGGAPIAAAGPALLAPTVPAKEASSDSSERVFDWINFVLFIAILVYFLRKPLAGFFAGRSAEIERGLAEGRAALERARAQLAEAEEKMRRLGEEIAAFKESAAREQQAERERLQRAAEEESRRVLASARAMIESSVQAARQELRKTAVSEAVALAETIIRERLDGAARSRLVSRFLSGIARESDRRQN